ncbi:general transcription factor II-I repeat domain-containing protein 2-like [Pungitius pungitius]|uniref:general transcription factor II-I repeat domain-containing protein 2-like n=1 Tax=Pungitius pungitius TaxID=134920 RepID=UPI002E0DA29F
MAKRKVDTENRGFQTRWESEYMFTEVAGKPVCLLCGESVAVLKEYNLRRHYETKHADKNKNMDMEQRLQKAEELKRGLKSRQALFKKAKSQGQAAVKASFILAEEIAKSARPFTEGDFIKNCMIKVCDEVCPEKRQLFLNVSLNRNTIAERVDQLSINLKEQLVKKGKDFIAYSLAVDESTDISDIAQLSIFIRGVDSSLSVTEEFLALRPMHGTTTGHDLYEEVSRCVNEMELPWEKLVGLTTDRAPAMCGHRSGLVAKIREKMQEENATGELTAYHCIIHQEALCGKALKMEHVMSIITRTVNFIRAKGLNHRQFKAFLTELETEHETHLQGSFVAESLHLEGYNMFKRNRHLSYTNVPQIANRGGVAVFVKSHIQVREKQYVHNVTDLEFVALKVEAPVRALIAAVYRPPDYSVRSFMSNLGSLLDSLEIMDCQPINVCGDFNENLFSNTGKPILELFQSRGYAQVITNACHDSYDAEAGSFAEESSVSHHCPSDSPTFMQHQAPP